MVHIKNKEEIELMKEGGKMLAKVRKKLVAMIKPGITTSELESASRALISDLGAKPAFLHYRGYPAAICTSVNDEVVHCVPSDRVLKEGDIVSLDMGLIHEDFNLDTAITVGVGKIGKNAQRLMEVTKKALDIGISKAKPGNTTGDIGHAIQKYAEGEGFGVVRDLVGHGIGRELHEEPPIPNYGEPGEGFKLKVGMVIAIEPMLTEGDWMVLEGPDGFTFKTKDGSLSAHFEHSLAITKKGPVILTK